MSMSFSLELFSRLYFNWLEETHRNHKTFAPTILCIDVDVIHVKYGNLFNKVIYLNSDIENNESLELHQ